MTLAQHQSSTGLMPRVCWAAGLAVDTAGEFKPGPTQCRPNVKGINSALVSTSYSGYRHKYRHDALNQSWVNVGPSSVTLAHIQRGAKHDIVTQYWANVWSAS